MFGFVTLNADLIITQWSDYLVALTGIHPNQAVGKPLLQLFPDLRERGVDIAIQHVLETGAPLNLSRIFHRYIFPSRDGTPVEQSALIHPLLQGSQVIGVILNIQDVSDRSLMEMELSHRVRLLEALRTIDRYSMANDLQAALQHTVEAASELLGASLSTLCLTEDGKCLRFTSVPALPETSFDCSQCGICTRLRDTRQPLYIIEPLHYPWVPPVYAGAQALLAVPLLSNDQVLGTLLIMADSTVRISGAASETLEALAGAAAGALLAHRLRQDERRRMHALEVIYQASTRLRSASTSIEILQQSLIQAVELVNATGGLVWVPSKDGKTLEAAIRYNLPEDALKMRLPLSRSLAGKAFLKGAPLRFSSSEVLPSPEAAISPIMTEILHSMTTWLYAPLSADGAPLGVMGVCTDDPRKFDGESLQSLQTIAEITAVAIQRVQNLERANQRGQQLEILNEVSQKLVAVSEVQEAYQVVARCLVEELGYALAVITERDPSTRDSILRVVCRQGGSSYPVPERIAYGAGITAEVFDSGKSLLLNHVADDPRYLKIAEFPAGSQLCVPVWRGGEVISVITVEHPEENAFNEADLNTLQVMAAHLGVAMSNLERYQRIVATNARLQIIDRALQLISSRPDTHSILQTLLEASAEIVPFSRGGVFRVDESHFSLVPVAFRGVSDALRQRLSLHPIRLDEGLFGEVYRRRAPVEIADTSREARIRIIPGYTGSQLACYPLVVGERVLAIVDFDHLPPDEEARTLLTDFYHRAAIALENARLFEESVQLAQQRAALLKIALELSVVLDHETLYHQVLESFRLAIDLDEAALARFNTDLSALVVEASQPVRPEGGVLAPGQTLPVMEFPAIQVAVRKQTPLTFSLERQTRSTIAPLQQQFFVGRGVHAIMLAPLVASEQALGVLFGFVTRPGRRLSADELILAQGMASQAAVALQRVDLLELARKNAAEMEALVKNTSAELANQKDLNQALLDATPEGVVIRDMSGNILYVNQAAKALTEILEDGVAGRSRDFHELLSFLPLPEDTQAWKALARTPIQREAHLPVKNGDFADFQLTISPILSTDGRPLGLLNVIKKMDVQNLTETKPI